MTLGVTTQHKKGVGAAEVSSLGHVFCLIRRVDDELQRHAIPGAPSEELDGLVPVSIVGNQLPDGHGSRVRSQCLDDGDLLSSLVDAHCLGGDLDENSVLCRCPNAVYGCSVPVDVEGVRTLVVAHVQVNDARACIRARRSFSAELDWCHRKSRMVFLCATCPVRRNAYHDGSLRCPLINRDCLCVLVHSLF